MSPFQDYIFLCQLYSKMASNYLVMRLILLPNLHKDESVNEKANIWRAKI